MAELAPPPKRAALRWLEGRGPRPERRAYAVIVQGGLSQPKVIQVRAGRRGGRG